MSAGGARCVARRCKKCHGSRKSVRGWFAKSKRLGEWEQMSVEERRVVIVQNKDKGCGRGRQRQVKVIEKAECLDTMQLSAEKPFLTKKQFLT